MLAAVPAYTFESLSHYDFELVVRDLLQDDLGLRLESFATGRDEGIDFRYAQRLDDPGLIVQAKHYLRSGFNKLLSDISSAEVRKVRLLSPRRYILATSVSLTPDRKRQLADALHPFVISFEDILGTEDLNNLLARHPSVERDHFKLWLTSTAVLEKVLHHDIYMRSTTLRDALIHKLRVYVPNRSFPTADALLEEHHVCIIAGMPGIGKSMLAEMLLVAHMSRGFEPVVVSEDISEAYAVATSEPQIFYYDDFLGQTSSLDKFGKNEDARLMDFMLFVARTSNKRFVLTTREYILAQAGFRYERLAQLEQFARVVINLAALYSPRESEDPL